MGVLVQFASVIAFTAWGLYLWADVKYFGENNGICNDHIKYVVFFFTIRATAPWLRGIWIAALVLSAVGLILTFGWKAMELFEMKRMAEEQEAEEAAGREVIVTPGTAPHVETRTEEKEWYFDISFTLLLCVALLLSLIIGTHESLLSSAIYATVMLELTVSGLICHIPHTIY
jgi:hypothetical protein